MNTSPHLSRKTLHLRRLNHLSAELPASNTDAQERNFDGADENEVYADEARIRRIEIRYRGNRDVNPVTKSVGVDMRKKCFSSASMRPF